MMHTGDKLESEGPVCKCMDCARKRKERRDREPPEGPTLTKLATTLEMAREVEQRLDMALLRESTVTPMTCIVNIEVEYSGRPFTVTVEPKQGVEW